MPNMYETSLAEAYQRLVGTDREALIRVLATDKSMFDLQVQYADDPVGLVQHVAGIEAIKLRLKYFLNV